MKSDPFLEDALAHDAQVRAAGLDAWIGAEPTFTRKESMEAPWLFEAEGGDKAARARALLVALAPRIEGEVTLLAVLGRHFPGEPAPRFALGARWSREKKARPAVDASGLGSAPVPVPVVDACELAWLTVTPDPGVVEVNTAPAADLADFLQHARAVYAAAAEAGLSPVRYLYNGEARDSGGGGQISLGGPSPARSPFFLHRHLLPSLLRYANHHPALSYAFAGACVGSAGQGPRPDEGVRERFDELGLALDLLTHAETAPSPEELWRELAPLLVDGSGNSHRAEINVEKLWNPGLPDRGKLGVVELRSLAMQETPERLTAIAALFRALLARFLRAPFTEALVDWGSRLHDRFALPSVLAEDLAAILADLDAHGVGLGPALTRELATPAPPIARTVIDGAELVVSRAKEFWPLLGDTASQESAGARMVDASTARVEIAVRVPAGSSPGEVMVNGVGVPLHASRTAGGPHVAGARYRAFVPEPGLHATLAAQDPLEIVWARGSSGASLALHGWIPGGGVYDSLPADAEDAAQRRAARAVVRRVEAKEPPLAARCARGTLTVDLRRATLAEAMSPFATDTSHVNEV